MAKTPRGRRVTGKTKTVQRGLGNSRRQMVAAVRAAARQANASRRATGGGWGGPLTVVEGGLQIPSSEPLDGDVGSSEAYFWYDDTAGTPTVRVKARDADGDLFTATIPLTAV